MNRILHRGAGEEPKVIYELQPDERWYMIHTGSIIIVHPKRPPKIVYSNGQIEELKPMIGDDWTWPV